MEIIISIILSLLILQLIFVLVNIRSLPQIRKMTRKTEMNRTGKHLSVLIPARNEEKTISKCLLSIIHQTVPPKEIIVLDDHSTDRTASVIKELSEKYPTIQYMKGKKLPSGWIGKSYACFQLAQKATGEWLLFLDSDVRLQPDGIEALVSIVQQQKTGMVSGFPKQEVKSWLEKLVVPMMAFTVFSHLPIPFVTRSKSSQFVAAHGGFIAISKNCYDEIGGHAAIKGRIVEDMELAKLVKKKLYPFSLWEIYPYVSMRMYNNAEEVWQGYRKNIYEGVNRNIVILSILFCYYLLLYVTPFVLIPYTVQKDYFIIIIAAIFLGIVNKAIIDKKNGLPFYYGLCLPISILCLIAIAVDSIYTGNKYKGYSWKGRTYY